MVSVHPDSLVPIGKPHFFFSGSFTLAAVIAANENQLLVFTTPFPSHNCKDSYRASTVVFNRLLLY